jgi:hypothetical protein
MRDWSLSPGYPLSLTLSADFRFGSPDYLNDHIWELELGGGDPAALGLRTTYGLRARSMRLFPRFTENGKTVSNPAEFTSPPVVHRFYPNLLVLTFTPLAGVDITAEYWVPASQLVVGRMTITNRSVAPHTFKLEWVGQLVPIEGQSLAPVQMQSVVMLAGRTNDLAPVVFMTGGVDAGPGPYPSLSVDVSLSPGLSRQLSWAQAALGNTEASFDLARRAAARPFDAERARIELVNASETVDIQTGDPDWDAAFALSQCCAFRLLFCKSQHLPQPSFVSSRQADQGYSQRGDGSDYQQFWGGQSPLEAYYLSALLPVAPRLTQGFVQNFLATQDGSGFVDCRPGLAGQRGRFLAAPLLATLSWKAYELTGDKDFLAEVFPKLRAFMRRWMNPKHDREQNSIPGWEHTMQTGFEENPLFNPWHIWAQGVEISTLRSPALAAMLYHEVHSLIHIAEALDQTEGVLPLKIRAGVVRAAVEASWSDDRAFYCYSDRDTHLSLSGRLLVQYNAVPEFMLEQRFDQPVRLLVRLQVNAGTSARTEITIKGYFNGQEQVEVLGRKDFAWSGDGAVATSRKIFDRLGDFLVKGLNRRDLVTIRTVDYEFEDHTLFLPLWAGIPDEQTAQAIVKRTLTDAERFGRPFGIPACPVVPDPQADSIANSIHLPWNQLIGEGLLAYGYRREAALLTAHLMNAIVQNLKRSRAFYRYYHAELGNGMGERNALSGLAPVGLFLQTLGVQIISPTRVRLRGENPFPWPVTVKYRGLAVTRRFSHTEVDFSNGKSVSLADPTDALISAD